MQTHVVIIGAGPAGLTAAYLLAKEHVAVTIIEADPEYVGGIARTVHYKGYGFDIGGHRFFSKSEEIEALWRELLPHDMVDRPRSSRIFYRKQFFTYPLKPLEALYKLGILESFLCVLSYLRSRLFPIKPVISFSDWVSNHFGTRLFQIFFKTYTEKVWGMKCEEISADWAAQRIKGLSLLSAILSPFLRKQKGKNTIKTLINTFRYPRKGPGMLWDACAQKIKALGGNILMGQAVFQCDFNEEHNSWQIKYRNHQGTINSMEATHVISSAPLRDVVLDYLPQKLNHETLLAAKELHYRDFLIVVLILKPKKIFNDNWIYVHEAEVDVARIQNFRSWSEELVPNNEMYSYGMEYFCFKDDKLWNAPDEILIAKATQELIQLGLAEERDIKDGCVVRQLKAYPVYHHGYQKHVEIIREELAKKFPSLYLVGRNGMHKYNNQDHAMMTAMLTVKNILAGSPQYDVWGVNQDAEYLESGKASEMNLVGLREAPETSYRT